MVVFPTANIFPENERDPTLLGVTNLENGDRVKFNASPADKINSEKQMKNSFAVPRIKMSSIIINDEFSTNLHTVREDAIKSDVQDINSKEEQIIVKKVAASLKSGGDTNGMNELVVCGPGGDGDEGDRSLSSGSSMVTISSATTIDPDPEKQYKIVSPDRKRNILAEKWYHTFVQILLPFLVAGVGTIGAGIILAKVQDWNVYVSISELFILVPALLGLKGNLDMCLASRLCTQANLGNMKNGREIFKMIVGNVALVQVQAIIAGILVSLFAMTVGAIMEGKFIWNDAILLITSSICTATSSCFVLDFVMIAVIVISYRFDINPDNLATPLASSIGDTVSITLLSLIASVLFYRMQRQIWILYTIIAVYLVLLPFWICIVLKNKYTRNVLTSGWTPVLSALFISGLGGLILDRAVTMYKGFVIFQPIINGIGGNLVSVQASRMSSIMHQTSIMGILPPYSKIWVTPWAALFNGVPYAKTARLLIFIAIPGQLAYSYAADYITWNHSTLHVYFIISYLLVSVLQVMLLLYVAHVIIHAMWRYKIDPDNSAIPYLTALGDLSGSTFLLFAFWFLQKIGKPYGD